MPTANEREKGLEKMHHSWTRQSCLAGRSVPSAFPSALKKVMALAAVGFCSLTAARALTVTSARTGVSARLDAKKGEYRITATGPAWSFAGRLGSAAHDVHRIMGRDRIGPYAEIGFAWRSGDLSMRGAIRLYRNRPLILFRCTYLKKSSPPSGPGPGPTFT